MFEAQTFTSARIQGGVREKLPHDSGAKHVTGEAFYIDDIVEPLGCLHVVAAKSTIAHGRIIKLNVSQAREAPGVACVLTATDIPGQNDVSPTGTNDDPCLADGVVHFQGQPLFAVAAETIEQARAAIGLAEVEIEPLDAILTIEDALAKKSFVLDPHTMRRGEPDSALETAPKRLKGRIEIGGQDHFYLEGQVSLAIPGEDGDVLVHCSTQHPSEVQHNVAKVLGRPDNAVTVEVRRMGGGFGGKETQASQWAALAALAAVKTGRAAKMRLDRDDDMIMTGKRHDFLADYDVGFGEDGVIQGLAIDMAARCGFSADLSGAIVDRAMFHADNCYYLDNVEITAHRCRTNTVSNTAFRGFGGPQGMVVIERVIEAIARALGLDPLEVRRRNLYGGPGRDVTPYHMTVEDNVADQLIDELSASARYVERRAEIETFNAKSLILKRGIALTPVKFGISFTTTFLNQAGALIHVYTDGSVHLNHGGTEMGQGLFIKVAQVVAEEFQIDLDRIKISATNTGKVPNTSATAASSGSDMNGMAALAAARTIRERLVAFAARRFGVAESDVTFRANRVRAGDHELSFAELVKLAYLDRVQLSATGFYRTPKIQYDRETASGRPFYYFAYGAAVTEVAIDTLTGESKVLAVDILHDVGKSLNPVIDLGQVEGGFIQGMGWLTTEELFWNNEGRLATHAPSTYKIPTCGDRPEHFTVTLWERGENVEETIHRSKAVGEPPLMLAISVPHAISDAISSLSGGRLLANLDMPATPERVLAAVEDTRARESTT
ncbi:MAG: xanthine dehydrogenase molybdopterin binding subunit [Alphaproteobacteria bacterium]|nr:xanthine dehydrogenase molybdopterin binding subunit [Alphaproteobacteria bacterium]